MHVCRLKYTTVHEIHRKRAYAWRSVEKIIEFQQEDENVCLFLYVTYIENMLNIHETLQKRKYEHSVRI